ncbi:eCIS core domain-containing protein [Phaeobacter marinintestinus]|uniref:eCIS core domain-containing protein n=1 Tax=Falsiphaeobacter marinintestinus TaxID=1492905 RepID=UPI0011B3D897|nr:DUF4157 domain-containing protein [Phaeobacter marinintestinus]
MTRAAPIPAPEALPATATIQRACACAGKDTPCPSCASEDRLPIQPKLALGRPGDRYEQEADRIAETVTAARPTPLTGPLPVTPLIQRQPVEEEEEETLQTKSTGSGTPTWAAITSASAAVAGGGRPLSHDERGYFEPRFGRDLSAVRLHEGARAGAAARGIGARAYALGRNIAFAPGQYHPESHAGRQLMAHEITHTIQQAGAPALSLQRTEAGGTWGGFWRNIGAAFSIGAYFSDEDLEAYLDQITELGGPALDYDSDNKALEIAKRINQDFPLYGHEDTVDLRKILILDMQDGATLGDEERAILGLLTSLDALEVMELFRGQNALSVEDLRSDIDGDNQETLDMFLNAMGLSAEGLEDRAADENCTPDERTAVRQSIRLSQTDIDAAIGHLQNSPQASQVRHSFFLAFRVDTPSGDQISEMTAKLRAVRQGTENAHYICDHGEETSSMCHRRARGYSSVGPGGRGIGLCFMSQATPTGEAAQADSAETEEPSREEDRFNLAAEQNDAVRSMLITHEAAHFYLNVDDNGYFTDTCHETDFAMTCLNGTQENCGTSGRGPDDRFDNADSYACFVHYLARLADLGQPGQEREEEEDTAEEGETLEQRAEALRGGNLGLRVHYPGALIDVGHTIYLANDEASETIVLMGEPENSGFSHEWSLHAGGETLPLTETTTNLGNAGTFATIYNAATVPEATKARLREMAEDGTERGEIVVRSTIYRGAPETSQVETRLRVNFQTEFEEFWF